MRRTAEQIEEAKEARASESKKNRKHKASGNSGKTARSGRRGRIENLKPWKPGQSGNPDGRPKNDLAREIARGVFEENPELIRKAFYKALRKGNAYVFKELGDRAYGKVKDRVEHSGDESLLAALAAGRKRIKGDGDANAQS